MATRRRRKRAIISGLDDYGLSLSQLTALGDRPVRVAANLPFHPYAFPGPRTVAAMVRIPPARRREQQEAWARRAYQRLVAAWPVDEVRRIGKARQPFGLESSVPARLVHRLAGIRPLHELRIIEIEGRRQRRRPKSALFSWYGVWTRFVIQIEGETRGNQTYEDRIIVVRARSHEEAHDLARAYAVKEESIYTNARRELVRWVFEDVVDSYETFIDGFDFKPDPRGFEVYSKLRERRIRPQFVWRPGRGVGGKTTWGRKRRTT